MKNDVLKNILFAALGVAIVLIGFSLYIQSRAISNLSDRLSDLAQKAEEATPKEEGNVIKELSVKTAAGTFTFTQTCVGEQLTISKNEICIGKNKLTGQLARPDGASVPFDIDVRDGMEKESFSDDFKLYDAPSLLAANVVPYDAHLYSSDYLPSDVILSYATSPSVNGQEGVGSIATPYTFLILADGGNGTPVVKRIQSFPQYNEPIFGPAGKGVWVEGPVCSGAACTMDPEAMQLYDVYQDSSRYIGEEKATLEYATEDWEHPDKKYRLWAAINWQDLNTVEATITETDGTTSTFSVDIRQ